MNRALRAATVGVLLFSPLAITACSAGQVNQTSSQLRDKVGPTARVGALELRQVQLAYPTNGSYAPGDDAELQMTIVNSGSEDDALTGVSGSSFSRVRVTGSSSGTLAPSTSAAATSTPASSSGGRTLDVPVPADSTVYLGQNAPTVTLVALGEGLTPAQTVELTFTFEQAGDVTVQVPVAVPAENVPQTSAYNFEQGENEGDEPGNEVSGGIPTQREGGDGEG